MRISWVPRYWNNGQVYSGTATPQVNIQWYTGAGIPDWDPVQERWTADQIWIDMSQHGDEWYYDWDHAEPGYTYMITCRVPDEPLVANTCYNYTEPAPYEPPEMLAAQLAQYLDDEGVGVFDETGATGNIFIETLPDSPDEAIGIYSTGGPTPEGRHPYDNQTLQIIVRGTQDPRTAQATAQQIYDLLHTFRDAAFVDGGVWVVGCHAMQSGPAHIGQDESRRHEYSLNIRLRTLNENRRT